MPNPYPTTLRERAVRAYETSTETYADVATRFSIGLNTLLRWVQRARATGNVSPFDKRGGWQSPVDIALLHRLVQDKPDRTTDELTRAYNREAAAGARVHRSSVLRAL
jgi:transposase